MLHMGNKSLTFANTVCNDINRLYPYQEHFLILNDNKELSLSERTFLFFAPQEIPVI